MTEQEWLVCSNPNPMLKYLRNKTSDRKLRLFACACSRQVWEEMTDITSQAALDASERYADGNATVAELTLAHSLAASMVRPLESLWGGATRQAGAARAAETAARPRVFTARGTPGKRGRPGVHVAEHASNAAKWTLLWSRETRKILRTTKQVKGVLDAIRAAQAALLRDIVGNPFRPLASDTVSLDGVALAERAYDERSLPVGELDPDRLAVLSDALEDAGCTDPVLLDHLRGPGPHVRGCWALDLILGKE